MKKLFVMNLLIAGVFVACMGFTSGRQGQPAPSASMKRGQAVFMSYCLACHQADGSGVPNLNPPLIKTKYVLGDKKVLIDIVLKGMSGEIEVDDAVYNGTMPPHNFLNDQQVADVLTYVRNSFGNKATPVKSSEVKAARARIKA